MNGRQEFIEYWQQADVYSFGVLTYRVYCGRVAEPVDLSRLQMRAWLDDTISGPLPVVARSMVNAAISPEGSWRGVGFSLCLLGSTFVHGLISTTFGTRTPLIFVASIRCRLAAVAEQYPAQRSAGTHLAVLASGRV